MRVHNPGIAVHNRSERVFIFIGIRTPEQNGLVDRFIRSAKEDRVWHHRFESIAHGQRVIGAWIRLRPNQTLGYRTSTAIAGGSVAA